MTHTTTPTLLPPVRAEYEKTLSPLTHIAPAKPLPWAQRIWAMAAVRRFVILVVLAAIWQAVALWQDNDLLLPSFTATMHALVDGIASGELIEKAGVSLFVLIQGYLLGIVGALVLTTLAVSTQLGRDLLTTLTSMLNPLPAIALLPLALMWFGLGEGSLIFVLVHSVLWPLSLNTYAGFQSVPETLRMAGRNYGLTGIRYVIHILIPAALPSILSGLKIGWAFAWRTLIAAELVFGASSGQGGLGWYIFQSRNELLTDQVFAGLFTVIGIGLLVETLGFHTLERVTIRKWGVQR